MLTGTPLDLTPFGALLTGIGWFYWLLTAAGLSWALRGNRPWKAKLLRALPVALVFGFLPGLGGWNAYKARSRLNESMALFEQRCKTAGEKINRTVANVDGVVWLKWRAKNSNFSDQFKLDDPYGKDCGAEGCIYELLRPSGGSVEFPTSARLHPNGYRYVETIDPTDGQRYRYIGVLRQVPGKPDETFSRHVETTGYGALADGAYLALERKPIERFGARYGIDWEDISVRQDRERWIAGGSLRILDLQNNEIIAKRIGYVIDPGQGRTDGFRTPWTWASSYGPRCPIVVERSRDFAAKVLQPIKQGE